MTQEPAVKKKPDFGARYGILYPLAWRCLDFLGRNSLYARLRISTAIGSDLYVLFWLIASLFTLFLTPLDNRFVHALAVCVFAYRYFEVMSTLLSILVRRFIKANPRGQGRASANRTVLLLMVNGLELFLLFAIFNMSLGVLFPDDYCFKSPLAGSWEALYYSVVTGTTLGYGDIFPTSVGSRAVALLEVLSVFLVFVVVISNVSSQRPSIPDLE